MPTKRKEKYADSTSPANAVCSGKLAGDNNDRVENSDVVAQDDDNDAPSKSKSIPRKKKPRVATTQAAENSTVAGQRKRARTSKRATTTSTTNDQMMGENTSTVKLCTTLNDDITKVKTAKHCAKQWESLFPLRYRHKTTLKSSSLSYTSNTVNNSTNNNSAQDVFNCKDLIIPPSHELVNNEVDIGIQRWKDLAARVIVEEDGPTICKTEDGSDNVDSSKITLRNEELLLDAATSGDKRKHRLLPYNFDYMCKKKKPSNNGTPTTAAEGDINIGSADDVVVNQYHHRPKVISLVNPTQTLDYESELWNVFNSMRTSTELEKMYALGSNISKKSNDNPENDDTGDANLDNEEISHGCKHTLDVKQNLVGWIKKNTRLDAHSLGRLRVRDCHANPVVHATNDANGNDHSQPKNTTGTLQTTIRFEILRHSQNLKRASGPDGNRMEVELHGSHHTLLDLHRLLVECSINASSLKGEEGGDDDGGNNNNIHPGVFFIENNFYTCGDVGDKIGMAIKNWLSDKKSGAMEEEELSTHTTPRQQHLGISSKINLIPMSEMKLEDLPLRLGVRYYHMLVPPQTPLHLGSTNVMSLANESAVYVTGIHTHKGKTMSTKPSIIIHDTWASPQRHTCLACNYFLATVVTVNDPLTDSAPPSLDPKSNKVSIQGVPLCSSCYRALHYEPANNLDQPQLKLRTSSKPSLVFSIEEYQRMVTASSLE